jgi:hypothetical protein
MKGLRWLCTAAALLTSSAWAEAPAPKGCQLKRLDSIDVTITPQREVLVPVTFAGVPYAMRLNLQSAASVIDQSFVETRKLPHHALPNPIVHYGNATVTELVDIDGFALGDARFGRAHFPIVSNPEGDRVHPNGAIGDIGMDLFANVDLELNLGHHKLNLFAQDHCPGAVVYWSSDYGTAPMRRGDIGNVYFPMELEGKKIDATLATSLPVTTLTSDVTKKLYGFDEHSADIESEAGPSGSVIHQYRAMALTSSGFSVINAKVQLLPKRADCGVTVGFGKNAEAAYDVGCRGAVPLRLGMNVLEKLRIYIATKEKMLYFTAADATAPTPASEPAHEPPPN